MRRPGLVGALAVQLALLASMTKNSHAEPVFTGKVSITGFYYTEGDNTVGVGTGVAGAVDLAKKMLATTAQLGYLELRTLLEGKRLWHDRLDLRLDLRLRFTGDFNFERKYDPAADQDYMNNPSMSLGISARGQLGGPEYDLRQAYGLLRIGDRNAVQIGRMFVSEADAVKIDGVRLLRRFDDHWEGSLFGGGYPNPYSRSVLSDYTPPCGSGVASVTISSGVLLGDACQTAGPQLGLAAGLTAKYTYSTLWGAAALVGSFFNGPGDGGPVQPLPNVTSINGRNVQVLQPASDALDAPRIYLSWLNSWRPLERFDLFANLVVDLYGSGGPQLTRLFTLGTLRLLPLDRLTLRLGYSHLSSLAINMYLNRLLYNRLSGSTLGTKDFSSVENNLTVLRTSRDEVRATADTKLVARLGAYLDGRFRYRGLLDNGSNPAVYDSPAYTDNTASVAGEVTAGLRDSGSIKDLRASLAYTALFNFRAMNHVLSLGLGRDFFHERLTADFSYVLAITRDAGAEQQNTSCTTTDPLSATTSPFLVGCFGRRSGMTHELGLTLTANPWNKLFFLFDYRAIALLTDPQDTVEVPTVLSHSLLLRGEFRW